MTITVPIADQKEKSQHDENIEPCQGSENRQEFYDSETKRIPLQDESSDEVKKQEKEEPECEPKNAESEDEVSGPCPPNSESDVNSNDPFKNSLDAFRNGLFYKFLIDFVVDSLNLKTETFLYPKN